MHATLIHGDRTGHAADGGQGELIRVPLADGTPSRSCPARWMTGSFRTC